MNSRHDHLQHVLSGCLIFLLLVVMLGNDPAIAGPDQPAQLTQPANGPTLPTDSVYQLHTALTDQRARHFALPDLAGQPVLISMFYNSCQFVCPMLIDTIQETLQALPEPQRSQLHVVLISFDPERDSVSVLAQIAAHRKLDAASWTLSRTDAASVRKLAAVLGIQYRKLPNGDFNHSTAIILLDRHGRIKGASSQLGSVDPALVRLIDSETKP